MNGAGGWGVQGERQPGAGIELKECGGGEREAEPLSAPRPGK